MRKLLQSKSGVSTFNVTQGIIIFFFLTFVGVTLFFFDRFGLPSANTYLTLGAITLFLLFFGFFLFKEEDYVKNLIPFNRDVDRSILVYVLGLTLPFFAFIIGAILFKFNITSFNFYNPAIMAPLVSSNAEPVSFLAFRLKATPTVQWFSETIGAPTFEETLLGFGFVIIGSLLTVFFIILFLLLVTKQKSSIVIQKAKNYKKTILIGGIIISVLIFTGIHVFNDTYVNNPNLFLFAALFRLVVNLLIFTYVGLGLEFGIAIHQMNNLLAFIFNPKSGVGVDGFLNATTTPIGLLLVMLVWIAPLLVIILRWQYMKEILKDIGKSLFFIKRGSFSD